MGRGLYPNGGGAWRSLLKTEVEVGSVGYRSVVSVVGGIKDHWREGKHVVNGY